MTSVCARKPFCEPKPFTVTRRYKTKLERLREAMDLKEISIPDPPFDFEHYLSDASERVVKPTRDSASQFVEADGIASGSQAGAWANTELFEYHRYLERHKAGEIELPMTVNRGPAKTGRDTGTQIDTSLVFNFDIDGFPVIRSLVDDVLESALASVAFEMEQQFLAERLAEIRERQTMAFEDAERSHYCLTYRLKVEQDQRECLKAVAARTQKLESCMRSGSRIGTKLLSSTGTELAQSDLWRAPLNVYIHRVVLPRIFPSLP